jgi:MtfA peptidase
MSTLLFFLFAIAFIAMRLRRDLKEGYEFSRRKAAPVAGKILAVPDRYKAILEKYFTYYQKLDEANKKVFERKVATFVRSKQFIPRNIDQVTIEAKVLIAASAVQLTFGLPNIYLQHFDKILVYPDDYYSSITKRFHKGEVNPMFGIIVLSWQSFVDGYIYPTDSINLGLHEMAHALRLENIIRNEEYQFFDDNVLKRFDEFGNRVCFHPDENVSFFRPYACTNPHEFFSVAVENFFERPEAFKNHLPELYNILCQLLHQDPLMLYSS